MAFSPRRSLAKLYPLHWLNRKWVGVRDRWRYHWLARRDGIELYAETSDERLLKDIKAMDLLRRVRVEHEWIPESLLPAGGAADHKFLYVLGRALGQFGFQSVLELGAGETTKLLGAYARHTGAHVVTLEHNKDWVERVRQQGLAETHTVVHCPLEARDDSNIGSYSWYALDAAAAAREKPFELLVVDGPEGTARWSRVGFAKAFSPLHADEWLVLWDDVERIGDFESFALLVRQLRGAGADFGHRLFVSGRTLGALFTPRFEAVKYFW